MIELYKDFNTNISDIRCTFLGRPVAQSFAAFYLFEKVLLSNPFDRIVELGTWKGNLSLYLYLYCLSEEAEFYSYDIQKQNTYLNDKKDILKDILHFDNHFKTLDVLNENEEISNIIKKDGRTIMFCDNGRKIQEFNIYAVFLKSGDIIGVHDWDSEISFEDIKETIEKEKLEMIFEDECIKNDRYLRFFKKK